MKKNNKSCKVAYLGMPGSFSFIATCKFFKKQEVFIKTDSLKSVFQKVAESKCQFGVIPLENSTTGTISDSYDLLTCRNLSIVGEVVLYIHHHLVTYGNPDIHKIKYCYSHPQAISQCKLFFNRYNFIKSVLTSDTASAALLVKRKKTENCAAIANRIAAEIYGLSILKTHIEDNKTNYTRFAVISKNQNTRGNKISLIFSVKHIPGSLYKALAPYARFELNLTKIESRPIFNKPWEYVFFLDFEIEKKEKQAEKVIRQMIKVTNSLKVLGLYEKGRIYET